MKSTLFCPQMNSLGGKPRKFDSRLKIPLQSLQICEWSLACCGCIVATAADCGGCKLQVAGRRLQIADCRFQVAGRMLRFHFFDRKVV